MATRRWWRDTLFKRLFLAMWAALVLSHLGAFWISHVVFEPSHGGVNDRSALRNLPVLPSLPPVPGLPKPAALPGPPPLAHLLLDYAARVLLIGLFAWFAARWLAAPMRRLSEAAQRLDTAPAAVDAPAPPLLDERHGTLEVRHTAEVFNHMVARLQQQMRARTLVLAAVSHDLRTPLTRLRLRLDRLPGPQPTLGQCIDDIHEMDALIDDVLTALRDPTAAEPAQALDLAALLQSMVDDLAEQGQPVRLQPPPPAVLHTQPLALRRLIGNLIGNALRHGGDAELALQPVPHGLGWCVSIRDHGPGIAEAELARAFEPYVRLQAGSGSGLGLHIVRELARSLGAELTLANQPGGGLLARLRLPG